MAGEKKEIEEKVINLLERVEVELIKDLPSMRKFKGDKIKTQPLNVKELARKGYIKDEDLEVTVADLTKIKKK